MRVKILMHAVFLSSKLLCKLRRGLKPLGVEVCETKFMLPVDEIRSSNRYMVYTMLINTMFIVWWTSRKGA